jgi:hypothetical protein
MRLLVWSMGKRVSRVPWARNTPGALLTWRVWEGWRRGERGVSRALIGRGPRSEGAAKTSRLGLRASRRSRGALRLQRTSRVCKHCRRYQPAKHPAPASCGNTSLHTRTLSYPPPAHPARGRHKAAGRQHNDVAEQPGAPQADRQRVCGAVREALEAEAAGIYRVAAEHLLQRAGDEGQVLFEA